MFINKQFTSSFNLQKMLWAKVMEKSMLAQNTHKCSNVIASVGSNTESKRYKYFGNMKVIGCDCVDESLLVIIRIDHICFMFHARPLYYIMRV